MQRSGVTELLLAARARSARRRRAIRMGASMVVAAFVIALVVAAAMLISYQKYTEWPWSSYPNRLHACGRDFIEPTPPETRSQVRRDGYVLVRIAAVPGWLNHGEMWTFDRPASLPIPGTACHVVMWVQHGSHFESYALSGGS